MEDNISLFFSTYIVALSFSHLGLVSLKHSPVIWTWLKMLAFEQEGIREALPPAHL